MYLGHVCRWAQLCETLFLVQFLQAKIFAAHTTALTNLHTTAKHVHFMTFEK